MTPSLHCSTITLLTAFFLIGSMALGIEAPPEEDPTQKKRGPVFSGGIRWRNQEDVIAYKGLVLTLGEKRNAFVCYDTELLRYSLGWVNDGKRFGLTVPKFNTPKPQVVGMPVFGTALVPGWAKDGIFSDPRKNKRGSLPENWAHHKGFYQHGRQVVLHYTVGGVELLELPDFESVEGRSVFTRTIQPLQTAVALTLSLLFVPGAELSEAEMGVNVCNPKTGHMSRGLRRRHGRGMENARRLAHAETRLRDGERAFPHRHRLPRRNKRGAAKRWAGAAAGAGRFAAFDKRRPGAVPRGRHHTRRTRRR